MPEPRGSTVWKSIWLRCPKCGAELLRNSRYAWCSTTAEKPCDYGMAAVVTIEQAKAAEHDGGIH